MRGLLLFGLLATLSTTAEAATKRYALIIAENKSQDADVPALKFADDDGAAYYELFQPMTESATLLTVLDAETQRQYRGLSSKSSPPTISNLRASLTKINAAMSVDIKRGDTPIFYFIYAGHGGRTDGGEGYINLEDTKFLRSDLFREVLAPSTARYNHVIIDACDSYFFVKSRGGNPTWKDDQSPNEHKQQLTQFLAAEELASYPNTGVILSTSSEAETHEWELYRKGIFSHELRSALTGAADVNADGVIEYSEIKAFIAAANTAIDDPKARLKIFASAPSSESSIGLVELSKAGFQSYLIVPKDTSGHFYLEDARGVRYADFNADGSHSTIIALIPSAYYYLRSSKQEMKISLPKRGNYTASGPWSSLSVSSRGATSESFRQGLFETPYGQDFYQGFTASSGDIPVLMGGASWLPESKEEGALAPSDTFPLKVKLAAGASLLSVSSAVSVGLVARSNLQSFSQTLSQTGISDESLKTKIERQLLLRDVLFGAAVASAGVGVLLYLPARRDAKQTTVSLTPLGINVAASF